MEQQSKSYSQTKNAFVRELIGSLEGRRFLDFGCGAGLFTVQAARLGAALAVGVDGEASVLNTARYFAGSQGLADRCHFVCGRAFPSLPAGKRFDVILLKDVLEHVEDDRELLCAAARALSPGGRLVLSTQNALSLNYLMEGTYRRWVLRQQDWCGWDATHVRFYTPGSLRGKLAEAGLQIVAWRSAYVIPHKLPAPPSSGRQFLRLEAVSRADRFLGRVFPLCILGWCLMAGAEAHRS